MWEMLSWSRLKVTVAWRQLEEVDEVANFCISFATPFFYCWGGRRGGHSTGSYLQSAGSWIFTAACGIVTCDM